MKGTMMNTEKGTIRKMSAAVLWNFRELVHNMEYEQVHSMENEEL